MNKIKGNLLEQKSSFKKFLSYLSMSAIILGSTFGSMNSANADLVAVANGGALSIANADAANDMVSYASDTTASTITLGGGDFEIATLTSDTAANHTATLSDTGTAGKLTISGNVMLDDGAGDLIIVLSNDASTIDFGGTITNSTGDGVVTITANATDIIVFSGTSTTKAIDATVDGIADGQGIMKVTGLATFNAAIGGTKELEDLHVSGTATFGLTSEADDTVVTGTATFTGAHVSDTAALSGTSTFSSTITTPALTIAAGTQTFNGKITASSKFDIGGATSVVTIAGAASDVAELELDAGVVNLNIKANDIDDLDLNSGDIVVSKAIVNGDDIFVTDGQTTAGLAGTGEIYMPVNLSNTQTLTLFNDTDTAADGSNVTTASVEAVVVDTALQTMLHQLQGMILF
jgi:hypothetical protein